ncbi:response regulator [Pseudohalocynthiibacter aestuariivivens]|uniref:Response regulator n=1 Tax=Roseovarius pelagicus TaxID=2980108 RepID=A0ABY6DBY7_9RHOB|nr:MULTISPECIES: response regulator [Rhodobacterales]QIE45551.1 response regulator [Pseudohalocynthiibacter aestuariivivens]UXX82528.1 response regulator [Roseovarius pelagicus]
MIEILHVEDDADIREIALIALSLSGEFRVVQCPSGEDAVRQAQGYTPDVLLLDVMMPGMNGPETLGHLRKIPAMIDVPVVFMTARAQQSDVDQLLSLGAAHVISKPFDPLLLGEQVKGIIQEHTPWKIAV